MSIDGKEQAHDSNMIGAAVLLFETLKQYDKAHICLDKDDGGFIDLENFVIYFDEEGRLDCDRSSF